MDRVRVVLAECLFSEREDLYQDKSYGNLADENTMEFLYGTTDRNGTKYVKRTKSFWRFGKQPEDIMEGMAMWRHRDLVQTEQERREERRRDENTIKRRPKTNGEMTNGNTDTLVKSSRPRKSEIPVIDDHAKYRITKSEIDHRIGKQQSPSNESIYGGQTPQPQQQQLKKPTKTVKSESGTKNGRNGRFAYSDIEDGGRVERRMQSYEARPEGSFRRRTAPEDDFKNGDLKYYDDMMIPEPGFYDDDSVNDVVMKTVKRKEILKQYYSSGTDTERNSSSSDPYDCIVVEDHLVKRENGKSNRGRSDKMEFSTFRGDGKEKRSSGAEEVTSGTLLPRTKLTKPGSMMQNMHKMDKDPEGNRDGEAGKRRKENSSSSPEKRSSKAYGPWYDLWSNEAPISQK